MPCRFENTDYAKYVQPKLQKIKYWVYLGHIESDIADFLGISLASFKNYRKKYSELEEIIEEGKLGINVKIQNGLLKKCLGFSKKTVTRVPKIIKDENGKPILDKDGLPKTKLVIEKEVIKEVEPDFNSIAFWLTNRVSEHWNKDKTKTSEVSDNSPFVDILAKAIELYSNKDKLENEKSI